MFKQVIFKIQTIAPPAPGPVGYSLTPKISKNRDDVLCVKQFWAFLESFARNIYQQRINYLSD